MSVKSKRSHEGYLLMDHRHTPGVADSIAVPSGLPVGAGRGLFEAPTITCSHCHTVVVINPLRNRDRAWCKYCDHYLCDGCGVVLQHTKVCRPFTALIDDVQELALKGASINLEDLTRG